MYDLQIEFPPPPIPRDMTFEVDERTMVDGRVLREPTTEDIDRLAEALRAAGAEAVGVCFLHGYANGANEQLVADALAARLGVPVCTSPEVAQTGSAPCGERGVPYVKVSVVASTLK